MGRRQILKPRSDLGILHGPLHSHSFRSERVAEASLEAASTSGFTAAGAARSGLAIPGGSQCGPGAHWPILVRRHCQER